MERKLNYKKNVIKRRTYILMIRAINYLNKKMMNNHRYLVKYDHNMIIYEDKM